MNRRRARGFTLIEVMIVVVIVAILAAVAVPSYQNQIQKTRRADAKEALTRAAAAQERWFFSNNSYTNKLTDLGFAALGGNNARALSTDDHYILEVFRPNAATSTYRITATATGSQANDDACETFEINQAGLKTAAKDGGDDNTAECWR